MRWSELKRRVEAEFAEEIRDRVSIHVTRHYHRSRCSHGWITLDGEEIADFCDSSTYFPGDGHLGWRRHALVGRGEMRTWDFKAACWDLLHDGVEAALASKDPLRQAMAVLHRKVGKRRLEALLREPEALHPLVLYFIALRNDPSARPARRPGSLGDAAPLPAAAPASLETPA